MSDRTTRQLERRGLPWDHPEVLANLTRRGLVPAAHVELASDVANWRDWPADALSDRVWRLYAADCAERALAQVEEPDARSVGAIRVARRYAVGEATREELGAARATAEDAARDAAEEAARAAAADAAWASAWSGARDAAADAAWSARDAAWGAAGAAAGDAAGAAAWDAADAARAAAWASAWDAEEAARDAARAAERSWQDRHLRRCLLLPTWPDWRETT